MTAVDDVDDVDVDDCVALEIDRPGAWIKIIVDGDVILLSIVMLQNYSKKTPS